MGGNLNRPEQHKFHAWLKMLVFIAFSFETLVCIAFIFGNFGKSLVLIALNFARNKQSDLACEQ